MNAVIIIESPNKIKKISQYSGCEVFATVGHFMNLESFDKDFNPKFIYDENKKKSIFYYIEKCKNKDVYIATDPDREGYAIGKMFFEKIKNVANAIYRAEFHEITKTGIQKGLKEAKLFSNTNFAFYDSFLGRRVGDRLIGFSLSPYLSSKLNFKGASAGRVQTPALSIITNRELEILEFEKTPREERLSYELRANFMHNNKELSLKSNLKFNTKKEAQEALESIVNLNRALIVSCDKKMEKQSPPKPFITSKLLKEASKKLKISTSEIQAAAQKLFESGLITYIRTDAETLSEEFLTSAESFYKPIYREIYERKNYQAKNSQAEAHEAIRITKPHTLEEMEAILQEANLKDVEKRLYELIFKNTVTSQLKNALFEKTIINTKIGLYDFSITIKRLVDAGFLGVFNNEVEKAEDEMLLNESLIFTPNSFLNLHKIEIKEIEKKKPKRFLESDFIEVLEKKGIGRPSTYATYTPILENRGYITIENKNREIIPTQKGMSVIEFFKSDANCWILDLDFTKYMEDQLDKIATREINYKDFMNELYVKLKNINFFETETKTERKIYPPSQKQIQFCEDISRELNIALPEGYKENVNICKNFIDSNIKKLKGGNKTRN